MFQFLSKVNTNVKAPLLLNFGNGILMRKPPGGTQQKVLFFSRSSSFPYGKILFDILWLLPSSVHILRVRLPFCKSLAMAGTSRCFMPTYIALLPLLLLLQRMILV